MAKHFYVPSVKPVKHCFVRQAKFAEGKYAVNINVDRLNHSDFGLEKLARNHTIHVGLVEGNSVRTGPKCNNGTICNNIWTQLIDAH